MRNFSPGPRPQLLGTQLFTQSEGSKRQLARLSSSKYLLPPPPDIAKFPASANQSSSPSPVSEATQTDYYDQPIEEDDADSDDEDADVILPLLQPAPQRTRFADDSICACCRFSLLKKAELNILDDYAKHVNTYDRSVVFPEQLKVRKIKHKFQKWYATRGHLETHRESWLFWQTMKSRYASYVLLALIRTEKNIVDNERFTREAIDITHKGRSSAPRAGSRSRKRSGESRRSTSTRDSKSRDSTSIKSSGTQAIPMVALNGSLPWEQEESTLASSSDVVSDVEVSYSMVNGKPSLHKVKVHHQHQKEDARHHAKDGKDPVPEDLDRYRRIMQATRAHPTIQGEGKNTGSVAMPQREPAVPLVPPTIVVSEPSPEIPVAPKFPTITITSPTQQSNEVLWNPQDEAQQTEEVHNSSQSRKVPEFAFALNDEIGPPPETKSRESKAEPKNAIPIQPVAKHHGKEKATPAEPTWDDENAMDSCSRQTTLVEASAKHPKPKLPANSEGPSTTSIWVIVGWFPTELSEPVETCVIVDDPGHFLPDLKKHITGLRGWRSLLSFKSVQGFGLYKCRPQQLGHVSHHTTELENLALSQFFQAMDASYRRANKPANEDSEDKEDDAAFLKRCDSKAWAEWVHKNLNKSRSCPFRSQLSLKLVLRWSTTRISIASAIPLLMAFIVGFWYSAAHDDPQTAWTIGSFIVTAGAFIIAILAALTSLKDGQSTPYPKVVVSDDIV